MSAAKPSTFRLDVAVGDSVTLDGGRIVVTVEKKSGRMARLRFVTSRQVSLEVVRPRAGAREARMGLVSV